MIAAVLWLYLAGAAVTLVLLRACMATRGTQGHNPPPHQVWLRQAGYGAVWPLYWVAFLDAWVRSRRVS